MAVSLFRKGSWVEDIDDPSRSDTALIDYRSARKGFIRAISLAYIVGFIAVLATSIVLVSISRLNWWRFAFNIGAYLIVATVLALMVYREAVKTWLHGHTSGRALTITEICSDAVYSTSADTVITSWSKGAERMLGYRPEEIIGKSVAEILPEDFMEHEGEMLVKLAEDGLVTSYPSFNVRKGGEVFPTEASITLLREPNGEPGGLLVVLRDRSYQVQIEDELRRIHDEMESRATAGPPEGGEAGISQDVMRAAASATVGAIAAVAERRDPYTAGHQRRVSLLATAIAREMGLPEDQVEGIRVAGILHDTGKVVIPAEILSKPSSLSEFEYGIIKTHPKVDSEIVEGIDFPWPVSRAVLQHHERMDGTGYPSGLKGDEIIVEARILAVADVVEAMSSHRPYRPARGIDEAIAEIAKGSGSRFDRDVAEACLRLFKENRFELV